jgi:hypothetical protein
MVMDSDDNGVCKTRSDLLDALRRRFVEVFPSFEHETVVDAISICEEHSCLRSWFCNCHHLAFGRF